MTLSAPLIQERVDEALHDLLRAVTRLGNVSTALIAVGHRDGPLQVRVGVGGGDAGVIPEQFYDEVLAHDAPFLVADLTASPHDEVRFPSLEKPLRFLAGVPLPCIADDLRAVMVLADEEPQTLEAAQWETLLLVARQAVSAIELKRHLHEQQAVTAAHRHREAALKRQNQTLYALNELGRALLEQEDRDTLLQRIIQNGMSVTEAEMSAFYLMSDDPQTMVAVASPLGQIWPIKSIKLGEGALGVAWQRRQTIQIEDYANWSGQIGSSFSELTGPLVAIPLIDASGEVMGAFLYGRLKGRPAFTQEEVSYLEQFARHATLALEQEHRTRELDSELAARRQTEQQLVESEARYRDLLDSATDIILSADSNGHLLFLNRAGRELLGYSEEETSQLMMHDLIHPSYWDQYRALTQKLFEHEQNLAVECPFVTSDGRRLLFEGNANSHVRPDADAFSRAILRDVTQQREAEAERIRAYEERAAILTVLPDVYLRLDSESRVLDARLPDAEYASLVTHMIGQRLEEVLSQEDQELARSILDEIFEKKALVTREFIYKLPNGSIQNFEVRGIPVFEEQIVLIVRNISERVQKDRILKEQEDRFRRLVALAREGILISDDGRIVDANPTAAAMLDTTVEALVGHGLTESVWPKTRGLVNQGVDLLVEAPFETTIHKHDGTTVILEIESSPVSYRGKSFWVTALRDVTDRRRDATLIQEGEERFSKILHRAPVGIVILNAEGIITDVNETMAEIAGLDRPALIGVPPPIELIFPDVAARDQLSAAFDNEQTVPIIETTMVRPDGNERTVLLSGDTIMIEAKPSFLFTVYDITERRRVEAALTRHELTFDNIQDGVLLCDRNLIVLDSNVAAERMFGYSQAEMLGMNILQDFGVERPDSLRRAINLGYARHGRWEGEQRFKRRDGAQRVADVVALPLTRTADGEVESSLIVAHDVTHHKQVQDELRAQKQLLESLVEVARATAEGHTLAQTLDNTLAVTKSLTGADSGTLFLIDDEGKVFSGHGTVLTPDLSVVTADSSARQNWNLDEYGLAGWAVQSREAAIVDDVSRDPRWVMHEHSTAASALAVPLLYAGRIRGVLSLANSQTHHFTPSHLALMEMAAKQIALSLESAFLLEIESRLVRQLSDAKEAAEMANRAKTTFLSSMSHELRTPLSVIIGYTEMLRELVGESDTTMMEQTLDKVLNASRHLLSIINDVLDLSKIEAGRMSVYHDTFEIVELVRGLSSALEPLVRQNNNQFHIQLDEGIGVMAADPTRVRQILFNLLSNAFKFTEKGDVFLTITSEGSGDTEQICFEVRDTGIGIAPDDMNRLFNPFVQVDDAPSRRFGGTGLGLVISQRLAQLMGGEIRVQSQVGAGSTFTFALPRIVRDFTGEGVP